MRILIYNPIIILFFLTTLSLVACKRSTPIPTDAATLSKSIGTQTKSQLKALHQKHEDADIKCIACHHKYENDDRIKKCTKCHDQNDSTAIESCITCHVENNKL